MAGRCPVHHHHSFDVDLGVDQWHGHNAFIRDGERVFRTYFINGRATRRWEPPGATRYDGLGRQELGGLAEGYPRPDVQV